MQCSQARLLAELVSQTRSANLLCDSGGSPHHSPVLIAPLVGGRTRSSSRVPAPRTDYTWSSRSRAHVLAVMAGARVNTHIHIHTQHPEHAFRCRHRQMHTQTHRRIHTVRAHLRGERRVSARAASPAYVHCSRFEWGYCMVQAIRSLHDAACGQVAGPSTSVAIV